MAIIHVFSLSSPFAFGSSQCQRKLLKVIKCEIKFLLHFLLSECPAKSLNSSKTQLSHLYSKRAVPVLPPQRIVVRINVDNAFPCTLKTQSMM